MSHSLNVFDILSAGDKELVHSSMIKLLLENEYTRDEVLKLMSIDQSIVGTVEKEKKIEKRNRYDLYFKLSDNTECVVENKFKAIPTLDQIQRYKRNDRKLILVVFSTDFLCIDSLQKDTHSTTAAKFDNDIILVSYLRFTGESSNCILTIVEQFLKSADQSIKSASFTDFIFLIRHYYNYLNRFREKLLPFIQDEKCDFKELLLQNDVFMLRNYLFHLQAEIIRNSMMAEDEHKSFWCPRNDAGSNTVPCVSFFGPTGQTQFFVEFQGATLKAGLLFDVRDFDETSKKRIEDKKQAMIDAVQNQADCFDVLFTHIPFAAYPLLRKIKENKPGSSSMAFKFDLSLTNVNKQLLVCDIINLMKLIKGLA